MSNSPGPLLTILVTYLYFCLYAGPRYMKNRKPFQLKNTLVVYNISQVIFSVVLVIEVNICDHFWLEGGGAVCEWQGNLKHSRTKFTITKLKCSMKSPPNHQQTAQCTSTADRSVMEKGEFI